MVKALRLNSKRVSNDQPHDDEKHMNDSQPDDAVNASKMNHGEQVEANGEQAEANAGEHVLKKGRGHTINAKLQQIKAKRMPKERLLALSFLHHIIKFVESMHIFSSLRQLFVFVSEHLYKLIVGKKITEGDVDAMWKHMKESLCLLGEVKEYAMKQVQHQYKNRHYNLHKAYVQKEGRPNDVSPKDWDWLVNNKWSDSKF